MKKSRFTTEATIAIIKEHEEGAKAAELCRRHGIVEQTLYRWKAKFGGMDISDPKRLKSLEDKNRRLKTMVADQALEIGAIKAVLGKKW